MPKFILPPKEKILDTLHAIDFRVKIGHTESTATFSTKSVYLQKGFEKKLQAEQLDAFVQAFLLAALGDGEMILYEDAMTQVSQVGSWGNHYTIKIAETDLMEFLKKVDNHPFPSIGLDEKDYDKSLHFYLGRKKEGGNFNIVIVPAFEKIKGDRTDPDHYIENRSFTDTAPFFAYKITEQFNGTGISAMRDDCRKAIATKDDLPDARNATQLVSYSVKNFTELRNNLESKPPEKLMLQFGRITPGGSLVIILSFLKGNAPINSKITLPESQGVCFDKGDLIPPPDDQGLWDSSLA